MTEEKAKAVALFGGSGKITLKSVEGMKEALRASAADDPRGLAEGGVYINFSGKRGVYEVGPDKDDIDPQEIWLVNILEFVGGWICWQGGRPKAKRMAPINGPTMPEPDFTEHGPFNVQNGEGWFKAKGMTVRSLDSGVQGLFTTNSKSGVGSMASFQGDIVDRMEDNLPAWPIIFMKKEKFVSQGNTNYKPTFEVYGYLDYAQVNRLADMTEFDDTAIDKLISDAEKGVTGYDSGSGKDNDGLPDYPEAEPSTEAEVDEEVEAKAEEAEEETRSRRTRDRTPVRRRRASV